MSTGKVEEGEENKFLFCKLGTATVENINNIVVSTGLLKYEALLAQLLPKIPNNDYVLFLGYGGKVHTRDYGLGVSGKLKQHEASNVGMDRELKYLRLKKN